MELKDTDLQADLLLAKMLLKKAAEALENATTKFRIHVAEEIRQFLRDSAPRS